MTAPRDLTGWRAPGSLVVVLGAVVERAWWMRYPWSKTSWWLVRCEGCGDVWPARRVNLVCAHPIRACRTCANRALPQNRPRVGACSSAA